MISEPFAAGNSIIHKLDPRTRIIFAIAYSFSVAASKEFPVLLAAVAISLVLILSSELPLRTVAKRLVLVNGLILLLWVMVPLTYGGESIFKIAGERQNFLPPKFSPAFGGVGTFFLLSGGMAELAPHQ